MSNQSFGRESSGEISGKNKATEGDDTLTKASRGARGIADKAQKVVSNTDNHRSRKGLTAIRSVTELMGHFANSAKRAADDLDPMLRNSLVSFEASPIDWGTMPMICTISR